ncbi:3970_t:CDS:2 [Ambispora leptoticha]|uniref:3970_t:CDS:1 n=1 Tax=Ambispora leptoticha TaxID=144679 RepID=A0A9N9ASJ4_9GLOM|nr:3970_t:CDS:2 [Ambispora leptoticha]
MSIDAAAVLQTVSIIRKQLTRGITITIENYHDGYSLRNMEYYCETDCFNAPTISIGPGKWGVGAFRSTLTSGTRGLLCYELFGKDWNFEERLFLLIGWHIESTRLSPKILTLKQVPVLGDNTYFLQVAQVDSPTFPSKRSERRRVFEMLFENRTKARSSTIALHVNPTRVLDYAPRSADEEIPEYYLSICASMATTSIANLKVELYPYHRPLNYTAEGPIQISVPEQVSLVKLVEKSFVTAENIVNDALEKLGIDSGKNEDVKLDDGGGENDQQGKCSKDGRE